MKKLCFLSLFISVSAFAFGGGGGGTASPSARYKGLDSVGVHFGGEGQVQIQFNCVPDEQATSDYGLCTCLTENAEFDYTSGKCTCKTGWEQKGTQCEFACTEIENCAEYDENCDCARCKAYYKLADNPNGDVYETGGEQDVKSAPYCVLYDKYDTECCPENMMFNGKDGCVCDWNSIWNEDKTGCTPCPDGKEADTYKRTECVNKCKPDQYHFPYFGMCYDCDGNLPVSTNTYECDRCAIQGASPRELSKVDSIQVTDDDRYCVLVCKDTEFRNDKGECISCSTKSSYNPQGDSCDRCSGRKMDGENCVLCAEDDKCECPENMVADGQGGCKCDSASVPNADGTAGCSLLSE